MKSEAERRLSAQGVHAGQQFVLQCLWEEDGLTAGQLAQRLAVEPGTVTRAVRRMTSSGLVERRPDEHDRRRVRIWLTPAGRDLRAVVPGIVARLDRDAVSELDDEQVAALFELLERVYAGLKASRADSPTHE